MNRSFAIFLTLGTAMTSMPALAQTATDTAPAAASGLDDIVVTARKRSESAQSVPLALTAIGEAALDRAKVTNLTDIQTLAPNVRIAQGAASQSVAAIYIRGFGANTNDPAADPAIAVNIDGVYQPTTVGTLLDAFDIDRIEVLRGPQNTLLGKNSPAGAINIYTKRPTGDLSGKVQLDYGRFNRFEARGLLNVPIIEGILAAKVSFLVKRGGNYIENVAFPGRDKLGGSKVFAGRVGVLFTPNDQVDWYVTGSAVRDRSPQQGLRSISDNVSYLPFQPTPVACSVFNYCNATPNRFTTGADFDGRPTLDSRDVTSTFTWKPDGVTFTSITAYKYLDVNGLSDVDGTPFPIFSAINNDIVSKTLSQEMRLASSKGGPLTFGDRVEWLVGAYFLHQKYDANRALVVMGNGPFLDNQRGRTRSIAIFGTGTLHLTSAWDVTVGLRQTWDSKAHNFVSTGFPESTRVFEWASFKNFSKEVGTQYKIDSTKLLYARYAEGYRGGGFVGVPSAPADATTFFPETSKSYELGLKSEFLDRKLRVNISLFETDFKNLQRSISIPSNTGSGLAQVTQNAANAKTRGGEVEIMAVPVRALTLTANFAYLHARYSTYTADIVGDGVQRDLSGFRFPFSPKFSMQLGASYRIEVADRDAIRLSADYDYRTSQSLNVIDTPSANQAAYGLVNASIGYELNDGRYSLTAYGRNILNKKYYATFEPAGNLSSIVLDGRPAEWGLTLAAKF